MSEAIVIFVSEGMSDKKLAWDAEWSGSNVMVESIGESTSSAVSVDRRERGEFPVENGEDGMDTSDEHVVSFDEVEEGKNFGLRELSGRS